MAAIKAIKNGRREQAREERCERILVAARWLLVENASDGFSMSKLAKQAGLSLATPYNLFGGKAEILVALFEREVSRFHFKLKLEDDEEIIASIQRGLAQLSQGITRHRVFYFNLWKHLTALGIDPSRRLVLPLSRNVLAPIAKSMINANSPDGHLRREVLIDHFSRMLEINFIHWISGDWLAEQFNRELAFALFSLAAVHADVRYQDACRNQAILMMEQIVSA